jgi:uncharacterized protein (UPF0261 family)
MPTSALEPFVAVSTCPLIRPCAEAVVRALAGRGRTVRTYETDGGGGGALEADVRAGRVAAVFDLSLAELAAELVGGATGAGPDRLTAAALRGVPQVIVPGALDALPAAALPARLPNRPLATFEGLEYLRTTPAENDRLGREIAHKASAARGPTVIVLPRGGLSALDVEGGPFWWPEADAALVQSLNNWISPHVRVRRVDVHVNDPAFAAAAVEMFDGLGHA